MLITRNLTIPANTPETNPTEIIIDFGRYIGTVEIVFPEGCLYAVYVRILDNGQQIIPFNTGWLADNARTITTPGGFRISDARRIVLQGWSDAIDWPHTITFRMEIR